MVTIRYVTNLYDLQNVSSGCIFKVKKFQLDSLKRLRMGEEKHDGGGVRCDRVKKIFMNL